MLPEAAAADGPSGDVPVRDDAVSTRILDAALALAAASGVRNMTIDQVARRAGVGRMTVYRRFGDRERLVAALGLRERERCLAELDAAMPPDAPLEEQIAAAFATSVRIGREHPLLARLATAEPEEVLHALRAGAFEAGVAFAAARLRAAQQAGVVGPLAVEETAELLVRLAFSFVLVQESRLDLEDDAALRDAARRMIAPLLWAQG